MSDVKVKINTKIWDRVRAKLPEGAHVKVGVLAGAGGNMKAGDGDITMIELAAIHEFGSPAAGIPERSFIRSTFERDTVQKQLTALSGRLAKAVVDDRMQWDQALGMIGSWAVGQIKSTIKNRLTTGPDDQANRPSTIAKKGSSLPLVDTGRLINAITWLVSDGKK